MSTEDRALQIVADLDTTRTRAGFNEIAQQGENMASQVARSGEQAQRSVSNIGTGAARSAQSVEAAQRNIIGSIQRTTAAMQAGSRSGAEYYEVLARQRGVDPAVLAPYLAQLRAVETQQQRVGMSTREYSAAMRNVPAQITDIFTSLQGGMPVLTVALQQGGQLRDMFGGIAPAARALSSQLLGMITPYTALGAAIAAVGVAYYQGSKEADAFRLSIVSTGNAAGVTTSQLAGMAKEASRVAGTQGANAEALAALVGTGRVGVDQLSKASIAAVSAQKYLGQAVGDLAKNYSDLGKSPLQASLKLNESMNYLTETTYRQIKALELQGRPLDAAKVAQDAYSDATTKQANDVKAGLGSLQTAWNGIGIAAKSAWDFMLDVGREETIDEKIKKAENTLKLARERQMGFIGTPAEKQTAVDEAQYQVDRLKNMRKVQQVQAESDADAARQFAAARANEAEEEKYLTRREQQIRAIAKAREVVTAAVPRGQDPSLTEKAVQARISQIRAEYADVNNTSIESQIAAVTRLGAIQEEAAKRARLILEGEQQSAGATALDKRVEYAEKAAALDEEALNREKTRIQQRLGLTAREVVSEDQRGAQQQKLAEMRGQIALIDEQILTRRAKLSKDSTAMDVADTNAAIESQERLLAARQADVDALRGQVQAQKDENAAIGMTTKEAQAHNTELVEERARRLELDASIAEMILGREEEAEKMREAARLMRELNTERNAGTNKKELFEVDLTRATNLLNIMQAIDDGARQAAQGMAESFGSVGKAIGDLTTSLTGYQARQATIAAQLAAVKVDPKSDRTKIAQAEQAAFKASAQAQIKSYGDMASAAKGFFSENSKGYKVLETTERAFRAYEMAMALESMVKKIFYKEGEVAANTALNATKLTGEAATTAASSGLAATEASAWGITAVVKAMASLPFPLNLAAGAATLAAVVAVGAKMFGGVGGGQSVSQQRQESQGTGTVFGDSTAKSDSIKRSLDLIAGNSDIALGYTQGMLSALRNIETSLGGLGNLLIRTSGITSAAAGIQVSDSGGFLGKLVSSIFGGKTSVQDTGFQIDRTTLAAAIADGVNSYSYADMKKSGGWFSSGKSWTDSNPLGDAADAQFTKVLADLGAGVSEAAKLLGVDGDAFTERLNSFVIDIGKISLKGLTGEQIQEQLEAVFSKVGDDLAKFGVAGLEQFQQVGEGYFETLTRIASDYANLDSILAASGATFGAVGMGSIAARENLIALAGGIDELAGNFTTFNDNFLTQAERLAPVQKYVTEQLSALGYAGLDTRDKFKETVLGLINGGALLTDSGAATVNGLLQLSGAFAQVYAGAKDVTKSAGEIADERADLQKQLDELTLTQVQLAEKAREAIDAHNQALYDQVQAAQVGNQRRQMEIALMEAQGNKAGALAANRAAELAAMDASLRPLQAQIYAQQDLAALLEQQASLLSIQAQFYDVIGDKAGAAAILQQQHAAALAAMDPALRSATQALWDAQAAAKASKDALAAVSAAYNTVQTAVGAEKDRLNNIYEAASDKLKTSIDKVTDSVSKLSNLAGDLHSTLDAISGTGDALADRSKAQAQIAAALAIARAGGPLPEADSLKSALSVVSKDASDQFATYLDYQRDLYRTQNMVSGLSGLADAQLSDQQRMLKTLEEQKKLLEDAHKKEIDALDKTLQEAKLQTDLLGGISTSLASLPTALAALTAAVANATKDPGVGTDALTGLYRDLLGRTPDAAGLAYWKGVLAGGASITDVAKGIMSDYEYKGLHPFAVGTNSVPYDMPAYIHEGERIIPAADNRELMARLSNSGGGNQQVVDELRLLRSEVAEMRARELYVIAKNTMETADFLDGAVNGNVPLATKEVETA